MYNLIYNPIQNTYFKISSRNGIKTLKNFLNFYFGSGNQHKVYINPLKNQKVRLIYDGEPHKNLKTNKIPVVFDLTPVLYFLQHKTNQRFYLHPLIRHRIVDNKYDSV